MEGTDSRAALLIVMNCPVRTLPASIIAAGQRELIVE